MSREKRETLHATMLRDYRRAYQYEFTVRQFLKGYILDPGYRYLVWYRLGMHFGKTPLLGLWCKIREHQIGTKAGICISCGSVGAGLIITHFNGIFVFSQSMGTDCIVRQNCTIGSKHFADGSNPTIGNHVEFGAGCKVLGNISIGNNVIIGANAVVIHDVPDNCVVGGIPAKILRYLEPVQ